MDEGFLQGILIFGSILAVGVTAAFTLTLCKKIKAAGESKGLVFFKSIQFIALILGFAAWFYFWINDDGKELSVGLGIYACSLCLAVGLNVHKAGWKFGIPYSIVQIIASWFSAFIVVFVFTGLVHAKNYSRKR